MNRFALWLAGCVGAEPALDPSPWDPDLPEGATERLDTGTLAAEAESILAQLLGLHNVPVLELYWLEMGYRDPTCPASQTSDNGDGTYTDSWEDACWTADGAWFDGQVYGRRAEDLRTGGYVYDGSDFKGWASITSPAGETLVVGGYTTVYRGEAEDGSGDLHTYSHGRTDILWSGSGYADAWFSRGLHPGLDLDAWWEGGAPRVAIGGQASGFEGEIGSVELETLSAMAPGIGSACPEELGGELSLRDRAGTWYDVRFDGPTEPDGEVGPGACDGCGAVSVEGEPLGELCLSPEVLLNWEQSPW